MKTNSSVFSNRSLQPQTDCSPHRRRRAKNHRAVGVHNLCIIQAVKCPSKHAKGDLSNPSLERPSQTLLIRSPFTRASGLAGDNGLNESQHIGLGNGSAALTVFINHSRGFYCRGGAESRPRLTAPQSGKRRRAAVTTSAE